MEINRFRFNLPTPFYVVINVYHYSYALIIAAVAAYRQQPQKNIFRNSPLKRHGYKNR